MKREIIIMCNSDYNFQNPAYLMPTTWKILVKALGIQLRIKKIKSCPHGISQFGSFRSRCWGPIKNEKANMCVCVCEGRGGVVYCLWNINIKREEAELARKLSDCGRDRHSWKERGEEAELSRGNIRLWCRCDSVSVHRVGSYSAMGDCQLTALLRVEYVLSRREIWALHLHGYHSSLCAAWIHLSMRVLSGGSSRVSVELFLSRNLEERD